MDGCARAPAQCRRSMRGQCGLWSASGRRSTGPPATDPQAALRNDGLDPLRHCSPPQRPPARAPTNRTFCHRCSRRARRVRTTGARGNIRVDDDPHSPAVDLAPTQLSRCRVGTLWLQALGSTSGTMEPKDAGGDADPGTQGSAHKFSLHAMLLGNRLPRELRKESRAQEKRLGDQGGRRVGGQTRAILSRP